MADTVVNMNIDSAVVPQVGGSASILLSANLQIDYSNMSIEGGINIQEGSNVYTASINGFILSHVTGGYVIGFNAPAPGPNGLIQYKGMEPETIIVNAQDQDHTNPSPNAYSNGSVPVTYSTACFCVGTLIRCGQAGRSHEIVVEKLQVGDLVETASGVHRRVRWLGHRTIDCRNHPRPHEVLPIRISAHAFAENRPARDLFVSPGHSICVDVVGEVLIPAASLINGSTIQQVEVDEVTYWHVELDSHDIILAENLPSESYLDMGNRGFFKEAKIVDLAAGPDVDPALRTHADFCRPFHAGGRLVETVRDQLRVRAKTMGWALDDRLEMHLEVDGQRVEPALRGLSARFHVPASAKDVWLVSPTARPLDTKGTQDGRNLGLCVRSLRIEDGWSDPRNVAIDDPLLCVGFHDVEQGTQRWTAGRARLPAALWEGCEEGFYLRVDLAGPPVPRWKGPVVNVARDVVVA